MVAESRSQNGCPDGPQVEEGPNGVIVHLQEEDTLIQIDASSTHIICSGDETLRCKLRDILLHCLSKF